MSITLVKNKKIWFALLFVLYISGTQLLAQETPKKYIAYSIADTVRVDGKADEASWKNAAWTDFFVDIEGVKTPTYKTRLKMLWDKRYLYFFAQLEEPHVWATLKQRDTVIYYNNDFEIFMDPDGDTHNYYELEINALNTVWDLFLTKPYRNKAKVLDSWDIQGLKSAVKVDGTLNNATDTDKGWTLEIAVPWSVITEASRSTAVPENSFWRINFSRVNWDFDLIDGHYSRKKDSSGKYLPEYNWVWSPQGVINMHEPEKWGYVFFSTEQVGAGKIDFTIPKDEHIKWFLYELYRERLKLEEEPKSVKTYRTRLNKTKQLFGKKIAPVFEKHPYGWNIRVKSPFSNEVLLIKEDGKFERHAAKK